MLEADTKQPAAGQSRPDLAIVGGGIMGLWAALHAARAGLTVALIDRGPFGQGASAGLIGALMPHMPDKWNQKKAFQFTALVELESLVARLENETGLVSGYRRTGRLIPLPKPHLRDIAERHSRDARENWGAYRWNVLDESPVPGFPADRFAAAGLVQDTLAARVFPRRMTALLEAALARHATVRLMPGIGVEAIDAAARVLTLSDGSRLAAGDIVIANGCDAFRLIETVSGADFRQPLGQPVKGQSALLSAPLAPDLPVLFFDGLYVIAHGEGRVAIGSTSENRFEAPFSTDDQLEALILRAGDLVPALKGAPVIQRWAGLRPKAIGREPLAGRLPDQTHLHALTGGFKISFGIAHRLAAAVIGDIAGQPSGIDVPESFRAEHHFALARG